MIIDVDGQVLNRVCDAALKAAGLGIIGEVNVILMAAQKSVARDQTQGKKEAVKEEKKKPEVK
ncbi:MAG: hypothetical protein ACXAEN_25150 [Candidatus Thorarchaeota archaeon]|jgi:hypothetical protein